MRLLALGALGLAGLLVLAGVTVRLTATDRHSDGGGPLGSEGAPAPYTKASDPLGGTLTEWTYGLRLCLFSGNEPAILDSVSPEATVGSGFRLLGAKIRQFTLDWNSHTPIISVVGYPPPASFVPDQLHDVEGFAVTSPCTHPPTGSYTELLIGMKRVGNDGAAGTASASRTQSLTSAGSWSSRTNSLSAAHQYRCVERLSFAPQAMK